MGADRSHRCVLQLALPEPRVDARGAEESAGEGTKVHGQVPDDKSRGTNVYDNIRKAAEERQKKKKEESIPLEKRIGQAA